MIQLFAVFAIIASGIIANKYLLFWLSPITLVGWRMFLSGIVLSIYYATKKSGHTWHHLYIRIRKDYLFLFGYLLISTMIPAIMKAYAVKHMITAKATLFGSIDPFATALYAYLIWGTTLTLMHILGMLFAISAVIVLILSTSGPELFLTAFGAFSYPELAAIGTALISRLGFIIAQHFIRTSQYDAIELNIITMLGSGSLALLIQVLYTGTFLPTVSFENHGSSMLFIGAALYTIFIGNTIGYVWLTKLLAPYPMMYISLIGMSTPLFVACFGYFLFHETLSYHFGISFVLFLVGLYCFFRAEKKSKELA
jgi:drug/metabolite transporter (DMT)-like permease